MTFTFILITTPQKLTATDKNMTIRKKKKEKIEPF